jgi:hypothetical protein
MSMEALIKDQPFTKREISRPEKAIMFLHNHPTLVKTLKISAAAFGMFTSLYTAYSAYNRDFNLKTASIGAIGTLSIGISSLAHIVLDIIAPPKHNMKNHLFTPAKTNDAELYYVGDIPVLKITNNNPYFAGLSHGFLLAKNIDKLRNAFTLAMQTLPPLMPFIHSTPRVEKLKTVIAEVKKKLPEDYINEMLGIVDGYNNWAKSKYFFNRPKPLILDELILIHLEPDVPHFKHLQAENNLKKPAACAAIIDREKDGTIIFGRMMDWPTLGNADAIVIVKENPITKIKTIEVSIPGTIFTLTGMNDHGLSLCMNICYGKTTEVNGMPNAFVTKEILNNCKTLKDVERLLPKINSLGPFHLIAADEKSAAAFYIKQNEKKEIIKDVLKDKQIIVTNLSRDPKVTDNVNFAKEREEKINALFEFTEHKDTLRSKIIELALQLPYVNNIMSSHKIIMRPNIFISLAFDTAYAGKQKMQALNLRSLFG